MVRNRVQNQFNGGISRFLGLNGGIIGVVGKKGFKMDFTSSGKGQNMIFSINSNWLYSLKAFI